MPEYSFFIVILIYGAITVFARARKTGSRQKPDKPADRIRGRRPNPEEAPAPMAGTRQSPYRGSSHAPTRPVIRQQGQAAPEGRIPRDRVRERTAGRQIQQSAPPTRQVKGRPLPFEPERTLTKAAAPVRGIPKPVAPTPEDYGSTTLTGRQAPRHEGPLHEETIAHLYQLDECASPAKDFISSDKQGALNLAEGMIWSQVLGPPRSRRPLRMRRN